MDIYFLLEKKAGVKNNIRPPDGTENQAPPFAVP